MQPQLMSFRKSGLPVRYISLPPGRLFTLVAVGGVNGSPLAYCRNAPNCQSCVATVSRRLVKYFCVWYRIFIDRTCGWSVAWILFLELAGSNKFWRVDTKDFEKVYLPLTCRPFDMRLVALTCRESNQVLPVGELVTLIVLNCGNGRKALISVLEVL